MRNFWYICLSLLLLMFSALMSGCASHRKVCDAINIKDSVLYVYKDSIRLKDSVIISEKINRRDSIVMVIDTAGKVIRTDSWHWRDTDRSKVSNSDVFRTHDSTTIKTLDSKIVQQPKAEPPKAKPSKAEPSKDVPIEVKKTHYWRTWWLGVLTGILLPLIWRYRKKILSVIAFFR